MSKHDSDKNIHTQIYQNASTQAHALRNRLQAYNLEMHVDHVRQNISFARVIKSDRRTNDLRTHPNTPSCNSDLSLA